MRLPPRQMRRARIEIIPMIDTIFFLLVFFMIASLTMIRMRAIPVSLPKNSPSGAASGAPGANLILTVSSAGGYYLGKRRLGADRSALQSALVAQLQANPTKSIVLNLGKNQTYQALIAVMDVVNKARTASGQAVPVQIATEPIDQDGRALPSVPPTGP